MRCLVPARQPQDTGAPNNRMFPNTPEVSHGKWFLYTLEACLVNLELPYKNYLFIYLFIYLFNSIFIQGHPI